MVYHPSIVTEKAMSEQITGKASFGLDVDRMVFEAWRIFTDRPLTLLGVSTLIGVVGIVAHFFVVGPFLWLPFTLCVPYAAVVILSGIRTDRVFLGWVDRYPSLLALYVPASLLYAILITLLLPFMSLLDSIYEVWPIAAFVPVLLEQTLTFTLGLAALLAIRRGLSPTVALAELFASRRHTLEAFLLGGALALFSVSGLLVCCIGLFATTTLAWICLGVAYYQIFEA